MKHLKRAAAMGRNGDNTIAHLTTGEIVIPKSAQTPRLLAALMGEMRATGHDLGRYTVGGDDDSRNPKTGAREYFAESDPMGSGADYGYGGDSTDSSRAASENATNDMVGAINADHSNPDVGRPVLPDFVPDNGRPTQLAGPSGFTGWVGDKVAHAAANPISTALNLAVPGVFGALNTVSSLVGGPTVGGAVTSLGRGIADMMSSGTQVADKTDGKTASAMADNTSPTGDKTDSQGPSSGTADSNSYNPIQSGPSGSGMSPLAQALAGMGIRNDGWNNWGRRKTLGSLVSSYDPNGRQYVTPWDYRG